MYDLGRMLYLWIFLCVIGLASSTHAQVGKGQQILITKGLQVHGVVTTNEGFFHVDTYTNANYSAVHWQWYSAPTLMGNPGLPWAKWAVDETTMPPQPGEQAYLKDLLMIQLGDEWELNNDSVRTRLVNWISSVRAKWPNTVLFHNNYGGQVNDAALGDYILRAQPDLLCFDTYPFRFDAGSGNSFSTIYNWYADLRRWRQHAKQHNIPLGTYLQAFGSAGENVRSPSPSEMRLQHSAALAFNCKVLIDFIYSSGASSLFDNPGSTGDTQPNALYYEKADCARRARNFGKTLVRLKPADDDTYFSDGRTTGIVLIRGRDSNGAPNPVPIGFQADWEDGMNYTEWAPGRNDPYLIDWAVTNKGTKNNGQRGDVFISSFQTLDENFDGPDYSNERYLYVVNGLSDMTGTAADCAQEICLNFTNSLSAVEMLNPLTGQVEVQPLLLTNGLRRLILNLNGGDAALFKFSDGAPFIGASIESSPFLYEPFSYDNIGGPVNSNTAPNWTNNVAAGVTNDCNVTAGSLSYSGLLSSVGNSVTNGGVGLGIRRFLGTNVNSGGIYFSGLFRINELGYGAGGWNGASTQIGGLCATDNSSFRLQVMVKSNSPSGYIIGVQKGGTGVSATFHATEFHANETLFLVGKYDFDATPDTVSLWINPSPAKLGLSMAPTNGFVITNTGADGFIIDRFNMRQNTATTVPTAMQWDELRFGTSWADVTPKADATASQIVGPVNLPDGRFRFTYSASFGRPGTVYMTTNLFYWAPVGYPEQITPNVYQFTEITGTNSVQRFYRVQHE